ncbi:MAG: molybdenum cofactor guanylyltransferase [Gemmatimonadetes bacterium]|nr:molybdenum cofactor guanylyltransferase [Gemmatimonadota bacterium]
MTRSRCVGVLLAGGAARRFSGMPKGLALVDGLRIADRVLAALRGATDRQVVVANDARAPFWFPGMTITRDSEEGLGPLHGLRTALVAAKGDPLIVVAWDMPGVSAVIPTPSVPSSAQPLCAYYAPEALAVCERLLAAGERRAGALHDTLPAVRRLDAAELAPLGDPARLLLSVDTLADLANLGGRLPDGEDAARR